ncbi:cytochrome P450 [Nocardia abscessus]|uniref:cytochrome P450 n=1 Tax=Nocardia TaxID=1817 RepID=UPI0018958063|nr:cytochrome P450 [Nocardia abscessus]MBF6472620.1 cytochrome P450 [Nocardia abscessus]
MTTPQAASSTPAIPAHVPPELVVDYDPQNGPEVMTFPPAALNAFRDKPIFYTPFGGGFWVLTRFNDIRDAFQNYKAFPQWGTVTPNWTGRQHIPLRLNPPEHHKYRRMLMPMFSPNRLKSLESIIRQTAHERLARIAPTGRCEFMSDFALLLPAATYCHLLGLPPEHFTHFNQLSYDLVFGAEDVRRTQGAEAGAAFRKNVVEQIDQIITEVIQQRREDTGDDIISFLVEAELDGSRLSDEDVLNIASLLFFAGTDSTGSMIGYSMGFLAKNPEYRQELLDDPAIIPDAVEELIRFHGFHHNVRDVAEDIEIAGVQLKAGDRILVHTGGANHDPEAFENPDKVDFSRFETSHLTFGTGIHRCLGAPLAKLQLRIALEEFNTAIPDYRLPEGQDIKYVGGQSKVQPSLIPLEFTPRDIS